MWESFITLTAEVRFHSIMYSHMCFKSTINWETLVTLLTLIRSLPSVWPNMAFKATIKKYTFITLAALVRSLSSVLPQMNFEIAFLCKYLITLTKLICSIPSVVCVFRCTLKLPISMNVLHIYNLSLHCLFLDVFWDWDFVKKPFHNSYIDKASLQYVFSDVFLRCVFYERAFSYWLHW